MIAEAQRTSTRSAHKAAIILAATSFTLTWVTTAAYGPACSPDSAAYLSTARNLAAGKGFVRYDGEPYLHWGPLYPLTLAAFGTLGIDALQTSRILNAAALACLVGVCTSELLSTTRSRTLAWIAALSIAFSPTLLRTATHAWSESAFILFVVLALLMLERYARSSAARHLVLAAFAALFACLTRYTGVCVVAAACVVLLRNRRELKRRLADVALFACVALAPLAIWLARNWMVSHTLTGPRSRASAPVSGALWAILDSVSRWFMPPQVPMTVRGGVVVVALLAMVVAWMQRRRSSDATGFNRMPMAWFCGTYLVFLLVAAATTRFDVIDDRLLSPLYVPLVFLGFRSLDVPAREGAPGVSTHRLDRFITLGAAVWICFLAAGSAAVAYHYGWRGGGYASQRWRTSSTVEFLRNSAPRVLYSNRPDALYLLAGLIARHIPRETAQVDPASWKREVQAALTKGEAVWLVLFAEPHRDGSALETLRALVTLRTMYTATDGEVFRVESVRSLADALPQD